MSSTVLPLATVFSVPLALSRILNTIVRASPTLEWLAGRKPYLQRLAKLFTSVIWAPVTSITVPTAKVDCDNAVQVDRTSQIEADDKIAEAVIPQSDLA